MLCCHSNTAKENTYWVLLILIEFNVFCLVAVVMKHVMSNYSVLVFYCEKNNLKQFWTKPDEFNLLIHVEIKPWPLPFLSITRDWDIGSRWKHIFLNPCETRSHRDIHQDLEEHPINHHYQQENCVRTLFHAFHEILFDYCGEPFWRCVSTLCKSCYIETT